MATKHTTKGPFSPAKDHPERKVEELSFAEYLTHKKTRKHIEELAVDDFIERQNASETS
ncbi:MAG TPA: hypothetical protein VGH16_14210 [Candidatus Binatia bacterium]|jgi:hypothetical protein